MRVSINEIMPGTFFVCYGKTYVKMSRKYLYQPLVFDFYRIETGSTKYDYDYVGYLAQGLL